MFRTIIETKYPEYYEELVGICHGAKSKGIDFSVEKLIAWNSYVSMYDEYSAEQSPQRCSAFIATGNATEKGDIVMAHNTHCNFVFASLSNIVLYIIPDKGNSFCMQTCAGLISSSMDWFICSNGIIGCETTISNINYKPVYGVPYYCRIRDCMQYCNSLDEYATTMLHENAGDYACSWLFGDTRTSEIMLFEMGLKQHYIEKSHNGVFYGMNSAIDPVLRRKETNDMAFDDVRQSSGSRRERFEYLLRQKYNGKINIQTAKRILADHYDMFLGREHCGLRSICKHAELSNGAKNERVTNSDELRSPEFPSDPKGRHACAIGTCEELRTRSGRSSRKLWRTKFERVCVAATPECLSEHFTHTDMPFYPYGAIDGKVVNTEMAKSMQFVGKYGASCNRSFRIREYLKKHPEYASWEKYLVNLPNQMWTRISDNPPVHFSKTQKIDFNSSNKYKHTTL
jgi:hypothetical protein